ncbi:hypothetical protein Tco_0276232 [Tanacetum coccineum]
MVASIIPISSDSSEDSMGSHVPIVSADPLVTPKVGAVFVTSHAEVLNLLDYSSSSDFNPSDNSLPLAPELPLVSPFLCSDDSKADSESEPAEQRPERHESLTVHDAMVSRLSWRRVSHHSSDRHSSPDFTSDSSSSGSSSDSSSNTSSSRNRSRS